MDLNLLKTFDAVMKSHSVNDAADSLGITAPAVSHALNRLREQYQDPLFIRKGRGIIPTNFAIELHAEIQEPLSLLLNGAKSRQVFDPAVSKRTFRISSHKDLDVMIVPSLDRYKEKYAPKVNIIANNEHMDEQQRHDDLRLRKVDLILATVPLMDHGYHNQLLIEEPLIVVCSDSHPRIKDSISREQFFAEKHLLWQTQRMNNYTLNSVTSDDLPLRKVAYTTDSICTALMMAAQTDWLCVTGKWHAEKLFSHAHLKMFPLPFDTEPVPIYMTWHHSQQNDTGHQWLKQAIVEAAQSRTQNI